MEKEKINAVEVECVEPIQDQETETKPKKEPRKLTDEEKAERARKKKEREEEEEWREFIAKKRRPLIAKALWALYRDGELFRQTIHYHSELGDIEQEMLYSHKSTDAKKNELLCS